ncbi:putative hydrolase of the HAD superfamily [bacterium A37T11]|nr:putative hydrolase of the HAD superfamily [bacterium A37T11]
MSQNTPIKALFLDIGGVFLTNGWDRKSRQKAAELFNLDFEDFNERHRIIFDAYEAGKMTLDEYLHLLIFYQPRPFSPDEVKQFMMDQSKAYPEMIELVSTLKHKYKLQTIAVNNEGRELNEYRIKQFNLKSFIDFFASSCYVHERKPDKDIWQTALDFGQVAAEETLYVDDRPVFIQAAAALGLHTLHHVDIASTREAFKAFGLEE